MFYCIFREILLKAVDWSSAGVKVRLRGMGHTHTWALKNFWAASYNYDRLVRILFPGEWSSFDPPVTLEQPG